MKLTNLKSCKDFEQLKANLTENQLIEIEAELELYESGYYEKQEHNFNKDGSPNQIIAWFEGLIDTDDFIEYVKEKYNENDETIEDDIFDEAE